MVIVKGSTRFLFVGDPHLDSITPVSRADNYRDITISKLEQILSICEKEEVNTVIFAGDMFTNLDQSLIYINRVIDTLSEFRKKGINLLTIVGNHDLPRNNMELLKNSPLYTLLSGNLINRIGEDTKVPFGLNTDTNIYGLDYTKLNELENIKLDNQKLNILVAHYGTDNTVPADNIPLKLLEDFDIVFLGHDHHPFSPLELKTCTIFRPGSLTRMTREKYNIDRDIQVLKVNAVDRYNWDVTPYKLSINKPEIAFKSEVFNEVFTDFYSASYGALFEDEFFERTVGSLSEIIDSLPVTVKEENKKYLKQELIIGGKS